MKKFIIKDSSQELRHFANDVADPDVEISVHSESNLTQVLESFTLFLKASGYNIDGQFVSLLYYDDLK